MKPNAARALIAVLGALCAALLAWAVFPAVRGALPRPWAAVSLAPAPDAAPALPTPNPEGVRVNTATLEQLLTLPGVGPATAQAILDARQRRPFRFPEDLKAVPGIGNRTLDKIRPHIQVP